MGRGMQGAFWRRVVDSHGRFVTPVAGLSSILHSFRSNLGANLAPNLADLAVCVDVQISFVLDGMFTAMSPR